MSLIKLSNPFIVKLTAGRVSLRSFRRHDQTKASVSAPRNRIRHKKTAPANRGGCFSDDVAGYQVAGGFSFLSPARD